MDEPGNVEQYLFMTMLLELSPTAHRIYNVITLPIIYIIILPAAAVYHVGRYLLKPIRHPGWTSKHYMTINLRRVLYQYSGYRIPLRDPEDDIVPLSTAVYRSKADVERVWCLPLREDVPKVSVLERGPAVVKGVPVPGFMIRGHGQRMKTEGENVSSCQTVVNTC
jgi:hypothetical protein